MGLFSDSAFLTVSRSSEDSSPNTIRPLQSTTRTPSFVRVASFNCIKDPPERPPLLPEPDRPRMSHQPIACAAVLASWFALTAPGWQSGQQELMPALPRLAGCEPDRDEETAATIGYCTTARRTLEPISREQT